METTFKLWHFILLTLVSSVVSSSPEVSDSEGPDVAFTLGAALQNEASQRETRKKRCP